MSTCINCARSPTRRRSRRRSRAFANRDRPGSAGRDEVRLPLVRHGERDLVADARARERVAGHEHLRATVDDRDLADARHGPLERDDGAARRALRPLFNERELLEVEHAAADTRRMALAAVFFDVGDTLVEGWAPRDTVRGLMRDALVREYGARDWYERFFDADI